MADSNRESTFGRGLMKYISSKLPYQAVNIEDKINTLNPKYEDFFDKGTKRDEALSRQSVSSSLSFTDDLYANVLQNKDYHNFMYANLQPDKGRRLTDYRVMAAYSEVADALDEICDEFINKDDNGDIVKIRFKTAILSARFKTFRERAKVFFRFKLLSIDILTSNSISLLPLLKYNEISLY